MSAADIVIDIAHVSKRFTLHQQRGARTFKSAVLDALRGAGRKRDFWALKDVSLQIRRGDTVGIIGANGAGKSTLLSLISRTIEPTEGAIATRGSVSSLLELGAGFHPDLSGRENIFLYGAIMGLRRAAMERRFAQIVAFAGLEEWIDEPVKHYSSGMYVRLGFSVAVEVDPDILIIDEVLAVGDAAFQRKCEGRIREFKARGKTLLVVSHDLSGIHKISDQLVLMDRGEVVVAGDPDRVVSAYQMRLREDEMTAPEKDWGTHEITIEEVVFVDGAGRAGQECRRGEALTARLRYRAVRRIDAPVFGFAIHAANGAHVYGNNTQIEDVAIPYVEGEGTIALTFPAFDLVAGAYLFSFAVHSGDHAVNFHRLDNAFQITVLSDKRYEGIAYLPVSWRLEPAAETT